jgi:Head domain of trimeric autotransporter adhesin
MPTFTPIATVRAVLDAVDSTAAANALFSLVSAPLAANYQPFYLTTVNPSSDGEGDPTANAGSIRIATAKLPTSAVAPTTMGRGAVDLQFNRTIGSQSASGDNSFATGYDNTASGEQSFAAGNDNIASGIASFATGSSNNVSGIASFATGSSNNVSGSYSFVTGYDNGALGARSFVAGSSNTALGLASFATGAESVATRSYQMSAAAGAFATTGDAQSTRLVLKGTTTNTATPLELLNNGNRLIIAPGFIFACTIQIAGAKTDGSQVAHYVRKAAIKNIGGVTALVGAVSTVGTDVEDAAAWDVTITADDTNNSLTITVIGTASDTIRWVATVDAIEIGIA